MKLSFKHNLPTPDACFKLTSCEYASVCVNTYLFVKKSGIYCISERKAITCSQVKLSFTSDQMRNCASVLCIKNVKFGRKLHWCQADALYTIRATPFKPQVMTGLGKMHSAITTQTDVIVRTAHLPKAQAG